MSKIDSFFKFIGHYKYLITIVLGILFCGVLSESSVLKLMKLDIQKQNIDNEIEQYNKQNADAKSQLEELKTNPDAVEKVARERYFMKQDDEDVFVLSTDEPAEPKKQDAIAGLDEAEADTE